MQQAGGARWRAARRGCTGRDGPPPSRARTGRRRRGRPPAARSGRGWPPAWTAEEHGDDHGRPRTSRTGSVAAQRKRAPRGRAGHQRGSDAATAASDIRAHDPPSLTRTRAGGKIRRASDGRQTCSSRRSWSRPLWPWSRSLLGLIVGSFANVCIHRLPRRHSVVTPPSRCPRCGAPIRPWDNVPVLSYLALGGRCRALPRPHLAALPAGGGRERRGLFRAGRAAGAHAAHASR